MKVYKILKLSSFGLAIFDHTKTNLVGSNLGKKVLTEDNMILFTTHWLKVIILKKEINANIVVFPGEEIKYGKTFAAPYAP